MKAIAIIGLFLASAGHGEACSSAKSTATESLRGADCSVTHNVKGEISAEFLSAAKDMGNGFVAQTYGLANGCAANTMLLVTDCASGETLSLGYSLWSMGENLEDKVADFAPTVEKRLHKGHEGALADLQVAAKAKGLDESGITPMRNGLWLSIRDEKPKHSYNMGCGCKLYYPEAKP